MSCLVSRKNSDTPVLLHRSLAVLVLVLHRAVVFEIVLGRYFVANVDLQHSMQGREATFRNPGRYGTVVSECRKRTLTLGCCCRVVVAAGGMWKAYLPLRPEVAAGYCTFAADLHNPCVRPAHSQVDSARTVAAENSILLDPSEGMRLIDS